MSFVDVDPVPLYDKYIRPLNPSGEHESSGRTFRTAIVNGRISSEKDLQDISDSYRAYIEDWNSVYGQADQQFLSKENRLKCFGDFYKAGMHKSKSFTKMDSRYIYLFGQVEYGEIEKRHREFQKKTKSPW